jgi:hypothetical protein
MGMSPTLTTLSSTIQMLGAKVRVEIGVGMWPFPKLYNHPGVEVELRLG